MKMRLVSSELQAGSKYFRTFNPSPSNLVNGRLPLLFQGVGAAYAAYKLKKSNAPAAEIIGDFIGTRMIKAGRRPIKRKIVTLHRKMPNIEARDPWRKNGMGGRTWYDSPGRHEMVIVFHDANRVGPHVDVHLGRMSVIYRVKPDLYAKLKYNRDGMLTEDSRKLIIDHVRTEIQAGARVPQNLDHSLANARATWTGGSVLATNYGSGPTRQVVSTSTVDVYKAHRDGPIEMYAPLLNPHRALYMYRLYPGDDKRAPILIWGAKTAQPPKLEDRLHLKLVDPIYVDNLHNYADPSTSTAKYDGSSCYVVIGPKGTTVWSPRTSVKTGEQIEYTHKLDGLANLHSDETIVAMGELLFRREGKYPWSKSGPYISSAEGSGILNANYVLPDNTIPEIRLYRVDRIGRVNTNTLSFFDNRSLQKQVAELDSHLKVVELASPSEAKGAGFEGVVVVPNGMSVNDGIKMKFWGDESDWRIDRVEFKPGERGGLAGVVRLTSLDNGREYKLGPGQFGARSLTDDMMYNPSDYEGRVVKVASRHGHQGRASKVVAFHDDK